MPSDEVHHCVRKRVGSRGIAREHDAVAAIAGTEGKDGLRRVAFGETCAGRHAQAGPTEAADHGEALPAVCIEDEDVEPLGQLFRCHSHLYLNTYAVHRKRGVQTILIYTRKPRGRAQDPP